MQRCNLSADFGGTNGKSIHKLGAFCFRITCQCFPNAEKNLPTLSPRQWFKMGYLQISAVYQ
jgi:hypothetical protein